MIFGMNFNVLDFFKFTSRIPQIAQILVSTFKIFQGGIPPNPLEISSFLLAISGSVLLIRLDRTTLTDQDPLVQRSFCSWHGEATV